MLEPASPRATATLPSAPAIRVSLPDPGIRSVAPRRPLLDLDPELGRHLTPERLAEARAELDVQVLQRPSGPWPINVTAAPGPLHMGLLLLEGVIASDVALEDVVSTELLGAGDLVRPWPVDDPERMVGDQSDWLVLAPCRMAVLDRRFALAVARFPEVHAVLLERLDRRARRLGRTQAIAQLNRVERRVLATLWHLAERWGRLTADGILIPLDVSHRLLAQLIGARRPTVSTAVGELARAGLVARPGARGPRRARIRWRLDRARRADRRPPARAGAADVAPATAHRAAHLN